jgi:hypothetical protein
MSSTSLNFTALGLSVGEMIYISGDNAATRFATAGNRGFARVRSIAANLLTFDKTQSLMQTEGNTTLLVQIFFGRVLMNMTGADIVNRTYQLERTLGQFDSEDTYGQVEYLTGAIPNEMTLNIAAADKVTVDLGFVAMDHEPYDGDTGPKAGDHVAAAGEDAFNTSSDFNRIKLAIHSDTSGVADPLFAFAQDITISLSNKASIDKAVGVLGGFDSSIGNFEVSGKMTVYFASVAAMAAVRANANVTLDIEMVKNNAGISIDLPLLTLGDGRANVTMDKAITLPISCDAATGADIDVNMDHTMLMVFFDYLPDAAEA